MSKQQDKRLQALAKKGMCKAQAADREGVSHSIAARALSGTDLQWSGRKTYWQPYGLEGRALVQFCYVVGENLARLRDVHTAEEVGRLTGMNKGEQANALEAAKYRQPYNYTLANIARIAAARDMTFAELIYTASAPMKGLENES